MLIDREETTSQIKQIIQTLPLNSNSSLITDTNNGMDLESNLYADSSDGQSSIVYNKIVVWKKNAIGPNDLPKLSLNDMTQILLDYFQEILLYNTTSNFTMLGSIVIGYGNNRHLLFIICFLNLLVA